MQAGAAEALSSPYTGNRGDSRGYRVLAPGLLTSHRCPCNATLEGGDEGHLAGAEASCQDPPSIQLYTETARLVKGGVSLPVFRCARGSTSLESFHLHLAR